MERTGYSQSKVVTDCPKGGDRTLRVELTPEVAKSVDGPGPLIGHSTLEPPDHRPLFRGLGFASLGLAAGSLAGLAVSASYHQMPSCDGRCSTRYDATTPIALTAVGTAAFSIAAGVLLWKGFQSPKRAPQIAPLAGGVWGFQVSSNF